MKNNYILFLVAASLNIFIKSSSNTVNAQENSKKRMKVVTFIDEISSTDTAIALPSNNNTMTIQELLKKNKQQRSLQNLHIYVIPTIHNYILSKAEQDAFSQFEKFRKGTISTNSIQHNFTQTVQLTDVLQCLNRNKKPFILQTIEEKVESFESTEEFDLTEHQDFIKNYLQSRLSAYHNKFWTTVNQLKKQHNIG